jgi:transcriptional regulator with XRE-family HTH domain
MLGQVETGKSMPTIGVLWKIATALDIPFAQLLAGRENRSARVLRRDGIPIIVSDNGGFQSRDLFPPESENRAEFYELRLAPAHKHNSEAHAPGTTENLVVTSGLVEIALDSGAPVSLSKGDAIFF